MQKAIKTLYHEHGIIKQALKKTESLFDETVANPEQMGKLLELLDFFKEYADGYHHHKEEEVLFPEMIRRNEMLEYGVVHEMLENHQDFREWLSEIRELLSVNKVAQARTLFYKYRDALLEHIAVEDDEVFQIAETLLNMDALETIGNRFEDCDRELGVIRKADFENLFS